MRRTTITALIATTLLAACGQKEPEGAPKPKEPAVAESKAAGAAKEAAAAAAGGELAAKAEAAADRAKAVADTKAPPLTLEEYERLLLALATCSVSEEGAIDHKCEARKALDEARNGQTSVKDLAGMTSTLGKKHIGHASPAVRIKAASLMGSIFGADADSQQVILAAIAAEKDPAVLRAMIDVVGSKGKANPEIGKMLVAQADHESPIVRKMAVLWLASTWNKGVPGGVEKLIDKMEKDADPKVRQVACEYAGKLGDDALLPTYERLTRDATDAALYSDCLEGLVQMWVSYPFFETYSEKAYRLTLKRLADKPRSEARPPWTLMDEFKYLGEDKEKVVAWRAKATWYKADALVAAVRGVVEDPAANWMARTGGVDSLLGLGAPKATFEAILKKCGAECNPHVKRKIEEALAAAK